MKRAKTFIAVSLLGIVLQASPSVYAETPFTENQLNILNSVSTPNSGSAEVATVDNPVKGKVQVSGSTLNVRTSPWGTIIGNLGDNANISIIGEKDDFYIITYKGKKAYIHKNYVSTPTRPATQVAPTQPVATGESVGTVKVSTSLNVRTGPWKSIIGSLKNGNKVKIIGKTGDWYKITYNGQSAYVHSNYIDTNSKPAGSTPVNSSPATNSLAAKSSSGGGLSISPCSPMPGRVSSEYGWRIHPTKGTRSFHNGIDLPVPTGTRLNALGNGTVIAAGYESGGGRYVRVRYDNGYESFYCHLKSYSVKKGQRVGAGSEIARSDNTGTYTTGAHLHMEIRKNGALINPRTTGIRFPK